MSMYTCCKLSSIHLAESTVYVHCKKKPPEHCVSCVMHSYDNHYYQPGYEVIVSVLFHIASIDEEPTVIGNVPSRAPQDSKYYMHGLPEEQQVTDQ